MIQLYSPNGSVIVGVVESVLCTAPVNGFTKQKDGTYSPDYCGESKVHWDTQEPIRGENRTLTLVVDDNGDQWSETNCTTKHQLRKKP